MNCQQSIAITIVAFIALAAAARGQVIERSRQRVLVEHVERNSEAARAGLEKGDLLLAWSREDVRGELRSPFDVSWIELEQSPRGIITLHGFRRSRKKDWVMGPDRWGLSVKPESSGSGVSSYRNAEPCAKGVPITTAEACPKATAPHYQRPDASLLGAWLLFRRAESFAKLRQWRQADGRYELSIQRAAGAAPCAMAQLFRAWAVTYRQRRDWILAQKYYLRSIAENQNLGAENLSVAAGFNDLGILFLEHRNLAKAEFYYRQALEMQGKLAPDSLAMARTLNNLGTVIRYPRGSALGQAERYYLQALAIEEKLAPEGLDVASTLTNLGTIAWQQGDLLKSENYLHHALKIQQDLTPDGPDFASSLNELGNVSDLQGDPVKGEEYIRRALRIRRKLAPGNRDVAQSLTDVASIAEEQRDLTKAERCQREALQIDWKLNPEGLDVAGDYNNLAYVARDRGDLAKSEDYQRRALAIEEKSGPDSLYRAETLNSLGDLVRERRDWSATEDYYRQALAIREKLASGSADHAATLAALAGVKREKGQLQVAEGLYELALNALESQTTHLGGSEEMRSDFRAAHASYYKDYIDLLLSEKRPDAALQVLERSRTRMLLEMMNAAHVNIRQGVDSHLLERERGLQAELAALSDRRIRLLSGPHTEEEIADVQKATDKVLGEHRNVQADIRAASPRYAALIEPVPLSTKDIQRLLDADTLLLEYSLGAQRSHVWAVDQGVLTSYELPRRAEIENAARLVYGLLTEPNRMIEGETESHRKSRISGANQRFEKAVSILSKIVLGPVAAQLRNKRLLVVADGALQYIPFAILPVPETMGTLVQRARQKAVPLVADHEIVSLPSVSVLAALRHEESHREKAPKAVAVLADPVFDEHDPRVGSNHPGQSAQTRSIATIGKREAFSNSSPSSRLLRSISDIGMGGARSGAIQELRLSRLWFTRLEADSILASTAPGQAMKAVDFKASRAMATSKELEQYRIVHFATHGILDSKNPELSGLVFSMVDANGRTQNGFLDLQDVYNLTLPAEMVVLSACETGLGKEIDGEGLLGLTRGFMYAGASRVVASLWRVSDVATAELMGEFYKAMEQQGMRPAAALRVAQIQMRKRKNWASPYYWAGFQLQGEWQ